LEKARITLIRETKVERKRGNILHVKGERGRRGRREKDLLRGKYVRKVLMEKER
jgi:hypothetical protein